ncbi:MAG: hypothetical protein MI919_39875, partial [Holophagales bacterium]|nr:hypothetical protein [Holophagales bacterium]
MAFLTLMERLAPAERAAFLLREVFDYSYAELAAMLEKSEVACRQLVSRARQRIRSDRRRFTADADAHRRLAEGFARAAASGDLGMLEQVLHEDVVMVGDGGGKALSALRPILGAEKVSRFFRGVLPKAPPGTAYEVRELNGEAAVVLTLGGIPYQTIAFDLVEGEVRALYIVRNPDKLRRLAPADSPS